jgi:CBS domain-containing protein
MSPDQPAPATATVETSQEPTVGQLMRSPAVTVEPMAHLAAAAYLMKHSRTSALVVVPAESPEVVGILTEADVTHAVADGRKIEGTRVADVLTRHAATVEPDTTLTEAAHLMFSRRVNHLPVVRDGHVVGIIDIGDLCRASVGSPPASG